MTFPDERGMLAGLWGEALPKLLHGGGDISRQQYILISERNTKDRDCGVGNENRNVLLARRPRDYMDLEAVV